jgi:2-keto-4-pentenoate hydratase/2-oxohepta-3-ene-1,7-dioic acid hydratase in catechol pathway
VAIGLNYADHAAEASLPLPSEPIVFQKAITSLSGPNDPVVLPKRSMKSDWEVELGIVIGRKPPTWNAQTLSLTSPATAS